MGGFPPQSVWPPTIAVTDSAPPRNGTVTIFIPVALPTAWNVISTEPALVETEAVTWSFFLPHSMNSFMFL